MDWKMIGALSGIAGLISLISLVVWLEGREAGIREVDEELRRRRLKLMEPSDNGASHADDH